MAKNKVINTVLQLRDNMSGGLLQAAKNAKKAGIKIDDSMMKATRQVVAFKNKVKRAAIDSAKNFGKIGTAAVGAAGIMAAKTGFSEALDLEGYRLQLETATKDTKKAGEIMRYAIDLANKTPFEGGALVEGAAKFEAMGMSATQWLGKAGDMAAATNKDFDQAVEALIDAQAGELERLKEFGITKAKILEKGAQMFAGVQLENNKGQIVNQEKFNEAMIALMQDRFAGGMEKQAGTFRGLWSTVTGVSKSALAKLVGITEDGSIQSGSALELLKGKVQQLSEKLTQWQQDGTLDALAVKLNEGLAKALDIASQAMQWFKENSDKIVAALKFFGGALVAVKVFKLTGDLISTIRTAGAFAKTVGTLAPRALDVLTGGIHNAGSALFGFIGKAAGFVAANPIVLGIAAAIAAGVLLWQNWDTVKAFAQQLWDNIKTTFAGIRDGIVQAFERAKEKAIALKDFFVGGFMTAIDKVKSAFNRVKDAVGNLINKVKDFLGMDTNKTVKVKTEYDGGGTGRNALGTSYWRGGLTRVNERGGEIMNLPSGTQIIPHDLSRKAVSGGRSVNVYVTVQGNVIGNRQFAREMGEEVAGQILDKLDNIA